MSHTSRPPHRLATKGVEQDRDALVNEAWRLVQEALERGTMTLKNDKVCALEPRDQLRHVQWLASMQKKRPHAMPLPKDIFVQQTQ